MNDQEEQKPKSLEVYAPVEYKPKHGPVEYKPDPSEAKCDKLKMLTNEAIADIQAIRRWAMRADINDDKDRKHNENDLVKMENAMAPMPDSEEARDPELVFAVQGVLSIGDGLDTLLKQGQLCAIAPAQAPSSKADDDDDDDDDREQVSTDAGPADKRQLDMTNDDEQLEDDDDEDVDETPVTVKKINDTAVFAFLDWEGSMTEKVINFETSIHPHGRKWWRYRYEYTVIESVVIACSIMVLHIVMMLLQRVSFFGGFQFSRTGIPHRFYRYSFVYFLVHAAALMMMVTLAYLLYVPWGQGNILDMFAGIVRKMVDGRANVPFLGESWLYMVLDVYFGLFACFVLYSIFTVFVFSNYFDALVQWRAVSVEEDEGTFSGMHSKNVALYRHLDSIMKRRVRKSPEYKQAFVDFNLKMAGVEGLDEHSLSPGSHDFKLHVHLADGLGTSAHYLTEVSLKTSSFLAISSLGVGFLAAYFQLAFMFFLPFFLAIVLCIGFGGWLISQFFKSEKGDHKDHDEYKFLFKIVSNHSCCRAIQIVLYCVFFSFSRLLLSNDIFEFYPMTYLITLLGLALLMILLRAFAGEVVKELVCSLSLPPHISQDKFKKRLEQMVSWHTRGSCHECGVEQCEAHVSPSRMYAGKSIGARPVPRLQLSRSPGT